LNILKCKLFFSRKLNVHGSTYTVYWKTTNEVLLDPSSMCETSYFDSQVCILIIIFDNLNTYYVLIINNYQSILVLFCSYIKMVHTLFSSLIIIDYLHGITSVSFALFQLTVSSIETHISRIKIIVICACL
jgi:hypothetical protein